MDHVSLPLMKAGALKEEERRLKKNIIDNLETQFVDEFVKWKGKVDLFNKAVVTYNGMFKKRLRQMAYDEFCSLFVKGSKHILNDQIRMENIVPNAEEISIMRSAMENADDADDFKRRYASLMEAKYALVKRKLAHTWDEHIFRFIVNTRYGANHYPSMLIARSEVMRALD